MTFVFRILIAALLLALVPTQAVFAQVENREPEVAKGIGVDSRTGHTIEMDVSFDDENNNYVRMRDLFVAGRPIMLSFNYSNCPKLCSVQLENMTLALREVKFEVGQDFDVVSVSMDPLEQSSRAKQTKEKYLKLYNRPESADGWHFLVGDEESIKFLADECGFRYKYVPDQKIYSHPPVFILLSPQGKIVRYIHGLDYDPKTIELALVEAAQGKIGSPINWLAYGLGCYMFDESTGKYTFQAMFLMRLGGAITTIALLVTLVPYWFFKNKKHSKSVEPDATRTVASPT